MAAAASGKSPFPRHSPWPCPSPTRAGGNSATSPQWVSREPCAPFSLATETRLSPFRYETPTGAARPRPAPPRPPHRDRWLVKPGLSSLDPRHPAGREDGPTEACAAQDHKAHRAIPALAVASPYYRHRQRKTSGTTTRRKAANQSGSRLHIQQDVPPMGLWLSALPARELAGWDVR